MRKKYAAFISYSHRYKPWVAALQSNLEVCLRAAGADPVDVFLDQTDLVSGKSWVLQLQEGLADAEQLILVATPESLASPRAADEWEGFISMHRDWAASRFHIVMLVDAPLPPFIGRIQYPSFVDADEEVYRRELRKLFGGMLGRSGRELPKLPSGIEVPAPPSDVLPTLLRRRLVVWLAPLVGRKMLQGTITTALNLDLSNLSGQPTPETTASAALVAATGDDNRVQAARRIVRALRAVFEEEEDLVAELDALAAELERLGGAGEGGLLSSWLARVKRDHSNLVPFFEHADLELLDRVYVQLELRPEARLLRGKEEASVRFDGRHLTIRDLLALDKDEHSWITHRWVVRGDPGAGKTTLLRHLAAKLATESERRWIPVFESLPRLMRKPEWLLDRLEREMRKAGESVQGLAAALDREGQEGRLLLLLDGLDEVPREDREDAEALLRQLSARWPKASLVVTSRPIGYRRPGSEFVELELLPFDGGQRRQFLTRWFERPSCCETPPSVEAVMETLRGESGLWDLSGNPLYLTLMALLFEGGKEPERNRAQLYAQVFDLLLDGRHRPGGKAIDAKNEVYATLQRLACDMTGDNRDSEPRADLESRLLQEDYDPLTKPLRRVTAWERSLGVFLDDLAQQVGILGPHDGPAADWRYWHRTFREALTAQQLAADLAAGGEAAILAKAEEVAGDEGRWAEPFALLVGQVEDPDQLVTSLVKANRALGLRALATAQRLSDETLRAVLNLTDEWDERRKVYEEVPDLLGEPERAVALIDQLRQRTRNGNDLYFLGEALSTVQKRWPEAERLVQGLESRFFDHIPAPPVDLFRWVETPKDGRVELWREIPAGEGWVGAADGEEDYKFERPRHRVKIIKPFALGAVPVTNAQYAAFEGDPGIKPKLAHHPRMPVTWYEAVAFCRWLSRHLPGARLPREEEWEYACRAGTATRYWRGDSEEDLARVGWYDENSEGRTHHVGEKEANAWGLYDMHGNVFEWTVNAWSDESYKGRSVEEPHPIDPSELPADLAGGPRGVVRVIRGGSYGDSAGWARSAFRYWVVPGYGFGLQGFRVLLPSPSSGPSAVGHRS